MPKRLDELIEMALDSVLKILLRTASHKKVLSVSLCTNDAGEVLVDFISTALCQKKNIFSYCCYNRVSEGIV